MKWRKALAGVLISVAGATLAGCAGPPTEKDTTTELPAVSIDGYGDVSSVLDYEHAVASSPTDQYSLNSPDYVVRVLHAIASRTDVCMVENGFPATAGEYDWAPYQQTEDRLFGLWSVSYASKYGVDLAVGAGPPSLEIASRGDEFIEQFDDCRTEATDYLGDALTFSQGMNIDGQIKSRANNLTLATDEAKEAKASWQRCMEDRGIVLEQLDGRPSAQYQKQGKESEIMAAVAEAECAKSTGAIQILYDIRAQYEAALIDSQAAQLLEFTKQRDQAIAEFEDAIAGQ